MFEADFLSEICAVIGMMNEKATAKHEKFIVHENGDIAEVQVVTISKNEVSDGEILVVKYRNISTEAGGAYEVCDKVTHQVHIESLEDGGLLPEH